MRRDAVPRFMEEASRAFSNRVAISTSQTEMTFGVLHQSADQLASMLASAGVREGDLVALSLPNSPAFAVALLALMKVSAIVALVSPLYRESELKGILDGTHPACFLFTPTLAKTWMHVLDPARVETIGVPGLGELVLAFPARSTPCASSHEESGASLIRSEEAVLLKFSSGSTGIPKGVVLTADNLLAEARNVVATLAMTHADRVYAPVPIFHSYGFDLGLLPMLTAGTCLILRDAFVPRRVLADAARKDVSIFLGVPSIYRALVETPLSAIPDLSHLRYLLSCTAPLSPELIKAFHEKFRMPICQHYGSSETGAATTHDPSQVLARPTSVGLPMKHVQLLITDENGVEVPGGSQGEVRVRSQVVARGYVMGHPLGASRFAEDTFRTGDLGSVDPDGFLYLHGRLDDVINVGGLKVSPFEVVQVLEAFPAVREAAVVGARTPIGDEFVYAAVTLNRPATENEILHHCRSRLSDYKIPRRIDILGEMPRGASGKIRLTPKDIEL